MKDPGDKVIEVRSVSKVFRKDRFEIRALDGISLDVGLGQFMALMGPSGSGKTTLLNLMAGIDRPTSGDVLVRGQVVSRLSDREATRWRSEHIGYVFQTFNLIPVLTAFENVELPLLRTKLSKEQRRKHVMTALTLVGLADRVGHLPKQLSGGEEQRVAIARAMVTDPTVILADEPTGDLDIQSAKVVMGLLGRLSRELGKTIVMVTHDPSAAAYADLVMHLSKGSIAQD